MLPISPGFSALVVFALGLELEPVLGPYYLDVPKVPQVQLIQS